MTKARKLRAIENAAHSIDIDCHHYACMALQDIGSHDLAEKFNILFRPDFITDGGWTFGCVNPYDLLTELDDDEFTKNVRLLALCLFYEIVESGRGK